MRDNVVADRIKKLDDSVLKDTPQYTQQLANAGRAMLDHINETAIARGAEGERFLDTPSVKELSEMAKTYTNAGVQTKNRVSAWWPHRYCIPSR